MANYATLIRSTRFLASAKPNSVNMTPISDHCSRERQPVQFLARSLLVVGVAPAGVLFQAGNPGLDGLLFLAARGLPLQMRAKTVVLEHAHEFGDVDIHHSRVAADDDAVLVVQPGGIVREVR